MSDFSPICNHKLMNEWIQGLFRSMYHSMDGKWTRDEGQGIEISIAGHAMQRAFFSLIREPSSRIHFPHFPSATSLLPFSRSSIFTLFAQLASLPTNFRHDGIRDFGSEITRLLRHRFASSSISQIALRGILENEKKRKKAICRCRRTSGIIKRSQSETLREMRPQRIFTDDSCSRSARGVYKFPNPPEENHSTALSIMRGCKHEPILGTCPCYFYETRAAWYTYIAWSANITLRLCKARSFLKTFELALSRKMKHFRFNREIYSLRDHEEKLHLKLVMRFSSRLCAFSSLSLLLRSALCFGYKLPEEIGLRR